MATNTHTGPDGREHVYLVVTRKDGKQEEILFPDDVVQLDGSAQRAVH